jgi:putative modified peptide
MAKNFSRDFADKLLDKLSHDDDFRDHFARDPHSALASLGHSVDESERGIAGLDPVNCLGEMSANLAPKEAIRAARDSLREQLSRAPFKFDVTVA